MSADGYPAGVVRACDECGTTPAPRRVDSTLGLAVWRRLHPQEPRDALYFCSDGCTFLHGWRLSDAERAR